jgi:heterotetrameric sarcosine oxidase gamma subunit
MLERRSALAAHPLMQTDRRISLPLAGTLTVAVSERRTLSILQVSAFAQSFDDAGTRLASAIDVPLPAPNQSTGPLHKRLRAIGPGIWQVAGHEHAVPDAAVLRAAMAGVATVVDLSHARTALQVSGPAAARTLAKYCGLDLEGVRFPTGSVTNTRFGHIGMTLARIDDVPSFELLVFRGYAEFVFEALVEAGEEFGLLVVA